jgi:hypothetical protein
MFGVQRITPPPSGPVIGPEPGSVKGVNTHYKSKYELDNYTRHMSDTLVYSGETMPHVFQQHIVAVHKSPWKSTQLLRVKKPGSADSAYALNSELELKKDPKPKTANTNTREMARSFSPEFRIILN